MVVNATTIVSLQVAQPYAQRAQYPLTKEYRAFKGSFKGCIGFGV